jgi:hypothetical protein
MNYIQCINVLCFVSKKSKKEKTKYIEEDKNSRREKPRVSNKKHRCCQYRCPDITNNFLQDRLQNTKGKNILRERKSKE